MKEKVGYSRITGNGYYKIIKGNVEVKITFNVKKYPEKKSNVILALKRARKEAYSAIYGRALSSEFSDFINFIATWFEPCQVMLKSRGVSYDEIIKKRLSFYTTCNITEGKILPPEAYNIEDYVDKLGLS